MNILYIFTLSLLSTFLCNNESLQATSNQQTNKTKPSNRLQFKNPEKINFDRLKALFNVEMPETTKKYYTEVDRGAKRVIDGWFDKRIIILLLLINKFQEDHSIKGNVGEIGVWQARSFIPLMHLIKNDEQALAVDCFELYEFNRDKSGGIYPKSYGTYLFNQFMKNVTKYCSNTDTLEIIKGDSAQLKPVDLLRPMKNGKKFRIFSVDGCHEAHSTAVDMNNAFQCLENGGVITIDDYFHPTWPGVSEGTNTFMQSNADALKPFLIAWDRVFFAHTAYAQQYFDYFKNVFIPKDVQTKMFFGVNVLIYDPIP